MATAEGQEERVTCPTCSSSNPFEPDLLAAGETLEMDCQGCGKRLAVERGKHGGAPVVRELLQGQARRAPTETDPNVGGAHD